MRRQHFLPLLALVAMVFAGCQQQKTSSLDEPIAPPPPQEKESNPLAFWSWGDSSNQDEQPEPVTKDDVLGNLTPELSTTEQTPDEVDYRIARTIDYNGRQFWDDLLRVLMLDESSRLTYTPQP